jgi:hypothetical protein
MIIQPWKLPPENYQYEYRSFGMHTKSGIQMGLQGLAYCTREPISDINTTHKRGDIYKFRSGYNEVVFNDWKEWFLKSRKDKMKFWSKIPGIPEYARNQYAILMCRYRITRRKYRTFKDYGSHLMFITGPQAGKLRRYYQSIPAKPCGHFPYFYLNKGIKNLFLKLGIEGLAQELYLKYGMTEEARTLFIETVQNKIHERS